MLYSRSIDPRFLELYKCLIVISHEAELTNCDEASWVFLNLFSCFKNRYTLDEFGTARRSAVVRGFIDALTRGGLGGTPRPIEMHSHDPLRYSTNNNVYEIIFYCCCWHFEFLTP